jgi:thioredoxin-related protein
MGKILIALSIILSSSLYAQGINWVKTFPKAMKQAEASKKPIFFVLSNHSNDVVKKILQDKNSVAYINKNFIAMVSYEDKSDFIPQSIVKPTAPSMWFLASNGNLLYQQQSYDGQVVLEELINALMVVDRDMKDAIEKMRLRRLPYKLNVDFKYYTNLDEAKEVSKKVHKPIFMLIGRSACKYCVKLKKEVLVDKDILKDLQKNFVVLVHDANTPVSYKYKTPGIPAIWFLKENGEPFIRPIVGFIPKKNLTVVIKNAKLEFKK